jgi:hypothetical protein
MDVKEGICYRASKSIMNKGRYYDASETWFSATSTCHRHNAATLLLPFDNDLCHLDYSHCASLHTLLLASFCNLALCFNICVNST